jgi:hypothetical protein
MTRRARWTFLLLLSLAAAATGLLAMGLPRLRLEAGLPLPSLGEGGVALAGPALEGIGPLTVHRLVLWILGAGGALLVAWALWRAVRGADLLAILRAALQGLLAIAVVAGAAVALLVLAPRTQVEPLAVPLPIPAPSARTPLGHPPALVVWLTVAGLALALLLLAAWLLRPAPPARRTLDLVGLEAERARSGLLLGGDARGVILACYARMSAALAEERGVARPGSATAREFEAQLAGLGLPQGPVHELTELFERARYGGRQPAEGEGARALACLAPIVEACRAAAGEA